VKMEEWVEKYSELHKRKYWANKVTGKTTWTNPTSAPEVGNQTQQESVTGWKNTASNIRGSIGQIK
jgi:hypothetical protein